MLCRALGMVVLIKNSGYLGEKRPRWGHKRDAMAGGIEYGWEGEDQRGESKGREV